MHRQTKTMGYGVMVTLQILVLSFLVRIQVAQLKRLSCEGRFFVVWHSNVMRGEALRATAMRLLLRRLGQRSAKKIRMDCTPRTAHSYCFC